MMGIRGNRQLSRGIVDFVTTCEELVPPHLIKSIIQAVSNSLQAPNPVATFNRAIGQIRRQAPPNAWPQTQAWLFQPHVVTLFSSRGTLWALLIWRDALSKLELGSKANIAFGMDKPGNPKSMSFTAYQDAAFYWDIKEQQAAPLMTKAKDAVRNADGLMKNAKNAAKTATTVEDELSAKAAILVAEAAVRSAGKQLEVAENEVNVAKTEALQLGKQASGGELSGRDVLRAKKSLPLINIAQNKAKAPPTIDDLLNGIENKYEEKSKRGD
ncbi:MAG: hypothetical protein HOF84_03830 [Rhodospirillales bacterium]|nr:hypothetical protein [Rhodospirillales bacterium]MBT6529751.1 hypothetical protein [Betaproteobacteria bacterium]